MQNKLIAIKESGRKRRKRGEVRQKILDAALGFFAEKGFEGASIRDIASKAGVTAPNIYYYFEDKQGLYRATLKESAENLLELLKKVDDPNASLRDRLIALGKAKMRLAEKKNPAIELWTRDWIDGGSSTANPKLDVSMGQSIKYMEQMIAQAVERGEIRKINPKVGVWYMMSLGFLRAGSFISKYLKTREPLSDDEIEAYVDIILKGLEK